MLEGCYTNNMTVYFHVSQPLKEKLTDQVNKFIVPFAEAIVRLEKFSQIEEYLAKHGKIQITIRQDYLEV
jgi:hypothetical protein